MDTTTLHTMDDLEKLSKAELVTLAEQLIVAQRNTAPKASTRQKAPRVTVTAADGSTHVLMDQQDKARPMARLAAASIRNLEWVAPLRLRAMGVVGGALAIHNGPPPYITVKADDGSERQFSILIGQDATDYYFVEYK